MQSLWHGCIRYFWSMWSKLIITFNVKICIYCKKSYALFQRIYSKEIEWFDPTLIIIKNMFISFILICFISPCSSLCSFSYNIKMIWCSAFFNIFRLYNNFTQIFFCKSIFNLVNIQLFLSCISFLLLPFQHMSFSFDKMLFVLFIEVLLLNSCKDTIIQQKWKGIMFLFQKYIS